MTVATHDVGRREVLRVTGLTKHFAGQCALDDVGLVLRAGEVCALVGQNGSGKSTLIKILAGYHLADPGASIHFRGSQQSIDVRSAPWRHHVRFIHQDLGLVPSMDVLDNLALGTGYRTGRGHRIRWSEEVARASAVLEQFGLGGLDVHTPVGGLGQVEKTLIAVARALLDWDDSDGLLVLDEPTAALSRPEVNQLFAAIRGLADRGVAVLFVSHRLDEAFEIGDRVVVLRDGRVVADRPLAGLDERQLLELVIGGVPEAVYPTTAPAGSDEVLTVRGLTGRRVRDVSFALQSGEIVGVAGLAGSGRDEVAGLLFGSCRADRGDIRLRDRRLERPSPRAAIDLGMALVPSDRLHRSVVRDASVRENITLPGLASVSRHGRVDRRAERKEVGNWITRVHLVPPNGEHRMALLSGGNQQKAVLARWLRLNPRVLLLDEPTQGVDVGAKRAIFALIANAASTGTAVLMCSSEAKDLAEVCDRVLVLRDGAIAADLRGAALSEERIVAATLTARPGSPDRVELNP